MNDKVAIHEEKVKLARELGLGYRSVATIQRKAERIIDSVKSVDEIKRLTDMQFKVITLAEIHKKLEFRYWDSESEDSGGVAVAAFLQVLALIVTSLCHWLPSPNQAAASFFNIPFVVTSSIFWLGGIACLASCWTKTKIKSCVLEHWNGDIPYGGLLAIKEAKEKRLYNFHIYYPAKEEKPLPADPVIIAMMNHGVMVEVFAWDDGVLYD